MQHRGAEKNWLNHFTVKWSLIKVGISVIGGRKKAEIRFQSRFHSRNHHSSNLYLTQVHNSLQFLKEWNVCKLWNLRNLFTLKKDTRNLPASLCDERGRGRITQWTINFLPNLSFSNFPSLSTISTCFACTYTMYESISTYSFIAHTSRMRPLSPVS